MDINIIKAAEIVTMEPMLDPFHYINWFKHLNLFCGFPFKFIKYDVKFRIWNLWFSFPLDFKSETIF